MRVTVHVHHSAEAVAQYRAWRNTLPGSQADQAGWGRWYLHSLGHAVMSGLAPPALLKGDDGDFIRWEFLKGVEFTLLKRMISRNETELIVMGVKLLRPNPQG